METDRLPEGQAFVVRVGERESLYEAGQTVALPLEGGQVEIRLLNREESARALRPPEPSNWQWQHQALLVPKDGELVYTVIARASASEGSGVGARLRLPGDARGLRVTGEDLAGFRTLRGSEGEALLDLEWHTRDQLERELEIHYQIATRPLDEVWRLAVPYAEEGGEPQTRFAIQTSTAIEYRGEGLIGPVDPSGLARRISAVFDGSTCFLIEGSAVVELGIRRLPVVVSDDAVIAEARWLTTLEADGAMLVEGQLTVAHSTPQGLVIEVPESLSLLACRVGSKKVDPVSRGERRMEIALPSGLQGKQTSVSISFTGKSEVLDPLEGSLTLDLPQLPTFVRELHWRINMPTGYQSETHGNLTRVGQNTQDPKSVVRLVKKLCRDEKPEIRVFYQSHQNR